MDSQSLSDITREDIPEQEARTIPTMSMISKKHLREARRHGKTSGTKATNKVATNFHDKKKDKRKAERKARKRSRKAA